MFNSKPITTCAFDLETMPFSRLVTSFTIETQRNVYTLENGCHTDEMMKKIAKLVFDDESYYINPSIALGLLYDDNLLLYAADDIDLHHMYFYRNLSFRQICREMKNQYILQERYMSRIARTLTFLKEHEDLLQLEDCSYDDLAISRIGLVADKYNLTYATWGTENALYTDEIEDHHTRFEMIMKDFATHIELTEKDERHRLIRVILDKYYTSPFAERENTIILCDRRIEISKEEIGELEDVLTQALGREYHIRTLENNEYPSNYAEDTNFLA